MLLRSQNIHFDGLRLEDVVFIDEDTDAQMASTRVQPDDVLLNITGASLGRCTIAPKDISRANVNQHVCILRPDKKHIEPRFLNMALQSAPVQYAIFTGENGSSREGLTFEQVGNFEIILPPLPNQQAIAAYLDQETARLDGLVAAKERLLGLLAEKRRALITHAVTRGLDPRAPLRDSGIPWLGEIPAHWETPPVYSRFEVQLGKMLDEKKIKGTHLAPYLRNVDVQWGTINTMDLPEMDFDDDDRVKYSLRAGDILVCEGGEVGRCAIWDGEYDECYYQKALHRLRVVHGKDEARFFVLVIRTLVEAGVFSSQASASTIQHLPAEKLRVVRYPAPPLSEQRAIVAHISAQTAKLDALRAATERTIALLKERRAALIAAAVTGQIKVEEAA
jgi:type I restriction enzyme S subunit